MQLLSVIVPVYGVERFIERCSRSLFAQTYPDLEFVFVDDATPDRSIGILQSVMEDYPERKEMVRIVSHDRNRGLAASRNTGLTHASGDFVICVDSDDWLEEDAVMQLAQKQSESNADIVQGAYMVHESDGSRVWSGSHCTDRDGAVLKMMQRTWDHFVAGRLIRRTLFTSNGLRWTEGLDVAEDRCMMTMLAYYARKTDAIDNVVYHYERRNDHALTSATGARNDIRNQRQELGNLLQLEHFFADKETVFRDACSRCVTEELRNSLQLAVKHSDRDEYYRIVSMIDGRRDEDLQWIGWSKGVKGWIKHRYGYIILSRSVAAFFKAIKEKFGA